MTAIVELSSGQMIDLSGCLALNTSADSQYQLFLKGFQKPIDLSESDGLQLKQLLEERSASRGFVVRSVEEQQQINQVAMEKLQAMIDRQEQGKPSDAAEKFFQDFQKIVDEHRPAGKKLFSLGLP
jgi:hypothetical protein